MIIDLNVFIGSWPSRPLMGDLASVRHALQEYGVARLFVSPLDAVWCRNPHRFNGWLYEMVEAFDDVWPVPILDPTVASWHKELGRAIQQPRVRWVRLLPAYSSYTLSDMDPVLDALAETGLGVIVQTRLEDPRRQHPLAQVPDVPASEIADAAARHPELTVIIGGARTGEIRGLKAPLLELPHLYADVSQADGMDAIRLLVDDGLTDKLVFGSHAPFFIPYAALARVVTDLDDAAAMAILGRNATRILGW